MESLVGWRWWRRVAVALVLCVSAIGCANAGAQRGDSPALRSGGEVGTGSERQSGQSDGAPAASDANAERQSNGAAGAPGAAGKQGNGAQAIGAPIKLPAYTEIGFATVDEERTKIENDIREACKPRDDLCVTTVVEPRNGSDLHACFGGTKPDMSTEGRTYELYPDTELVIYSEPGDCKATDSGVDQQTTDSSAPTDSSQPPTEQTIPPDDSQPPSSTS